jgi:hypothetical protein
MDSQEQSWEKPIGGTVTLEEIRKPEEALSRAVLEATINAATKDDLTDLKNQCNSSFFEVANMFLELQSGLQQLNERIDLYNKKSSHKI